MVREVPIKIRKVPYMINEVPSQFRNVVTFFFVVKNVTIFVAMSGCKHNVAIYVATFITNLF